MVVEADKSKGDGAISKELINKMILYLDVLGRRWKTGFAAISGFMSSQLRINGCQIVANLAYTTIKGSQRKQMQGLHIQPRH